MVGFIAVDNLRVYPLDDPAALRSETDDILVVLSSQRPEFWYLLRWNTAGG